MINIQLTSSIEPHYQALANLLINSVNGGASIGFTAPLCNTQANAYWQNVAKQLTAGERLLLLAYDEDTIVGAVQLSLCAKDNGRHRGEVEKLMVHSSYRNQGIAVQLMHSLEQVANDKNITLLVLDTRLGDNAEPLYRKLGFNEVGKIPNFTKNETGIFEATVIFYKQIAC